MTRQSILNLASVFALLLLAAALPGCGTAEEANASSGETREARAEPATESGDEAEATDEEKSEGGEGEDGETDEGEKTEEAVPVEVAELARGPIESVLRFSSSLEAEGQVEVISQAKRLVTELLVEEGDRVERGQLLLRLQDDEQRSALAKVRSQLAKAEREYEQQERLYSQELIAEQDFDNATYSLEQLQIALDDARRELGYTEVRAPTRGTITQRMVNLGDQVQIGQELFEIIDFETIVARIFVPEKHLAELRTGLPARISAKSTRAGEHRGTVKRIAPVVDPRSGTVKVTIDVGAQAGLRPGMYVDVDLVTATHADAVLVPKRALVYDSDQVFVYRLGEENRVHRVFIEPRLTDKHHVEPAEGLSSGDRVVVAGQAALKEGALVSLPGEAEDDGEASEIDAVTGRTERASA
jgi:membrane fusion protein (multidrug efflux system)